MSWLDDLTRGYFVGSIMVNEKLELGQKSINRGERIMLKCEQCGDVIFTLTPELFQICESCGGRIVVVGAKKEEKEQQSIDEEESEIN